MNLTKIVAFRLPLFVCGILLLCPHITAHAYGVDEVSGATDIALPYDAAKLAWVASKFKVSNSKAKVAYKRQVNEALKGEVPVLPLLDLRDPQAAIAQSLLLADPRLKSSLFDPQSGKALRSEVMSVKPALPSDRVGAEDACWQGGCFRVDIYNFYYNATVSGLVDTTNKKVVSINSFAESQPELSDRLKALATAIAKHEPAVQLEVGRYLKFIGDDTKAKDVMPVMIDTKSALKDTLCERSKHLCVAPTYVLGNKALWVIVDVTDMKVAGLRWTTVGNSGPPTIVTERTLENEYVFKNFCEQINTLVRNGWSFDYHLTSSDGLRIANAKFKKKPVFRSAKVVDWHVSYSRKDNFGYSDATGCPMFSSAVVVAFDGPKFAAIVESGEQVGFSISQDFRQQSWPAPCNYRYEERYEFYNDGRYRVAMVNLGRGCGDYATYRPILRIDLGASTNGSNYALEEWGDNWTPLGKESWSRQQETSLLYENQYSHRILDAKGQGYLLAPSTGEFGDGGRGDDAFFYATVNHAEKDEGDRDLVTLGSCCNTDYRQGPEQFMQPAEALKGEAIVLWYVPQMKNDGKNGSQYCWAENDVVDGVLKTKTWPCTSGPMFVPIPESGS